jgi:hypothetical protein
MDNKQLVQIDIEDSFSKHNVRSKIEKDILASLDVMKTVYTKGWTAISNYMTKVYSYKSKLIRVKHLKKFSPKKLMLEVMIAVLPKQGPQPIQAIAGAIGGQLEYEDVFDGVRTAAELLAVSCESNLFDIIPAANSETGSLMIVSHYSLEPDTMKYIGETMYLPPMLCKPQIIRKNSDSGYLTKNESVILGKGNHHKLHQSLDVLNIMNAVELELDVRMLAHPEEMKQPGPDDKPITFKQRVAFDLMKNTSRKVYDMLLIEGNCFHLCWRYDKRGRIYSSGYHVNMQANEYKKAIINLKRKEVISG